MKNWCQIGVKTIKMGKYKEVETCEALILLASQKLSEKFSTHLLTVLTKSSILFSDEENR